MNPVRHNYYTFVSPKNSIAMLHVRFNAHTLDLHRIYVLLRSLKDDEEHQVGHTRSHEVDGHAAPCGL
jgi:hypothetical protein